MKALLKILYFLLALVIIFLLAGVFLPKNATINASKSINASPEIIFGQVDNLKNWINWSPWMTDDTTLQIEFGKTFAGKGASYSWKSKKSGDGKMTITQSDSNATIESVLDFGERGKAIVKWAFKPGQKITNVTWTLENNDMPYFERYFMILFKKEMQSTFERGLAKLKEVCEELKYSRISEIKEVVVTAKYALSIADSASSKDITTKMKETYTKLNIYLEKRRVQPIGIPFTLYYDWKNESSLKFTCAIPIESRTWGWKEYAFIEITEGKQLQ